MKKLIIRDLYEDRLDVNIDKQQTKHKSDFKDFIYQDSRVKAIRGDYKTLS